MNSFLRVCFHDLDKIHIINNNLIYYNNYSLCKMEKIYSFF
jgi:hypothetical protein